MARIRQVKPELRKDQTAATWPRDARYTWVLLWGYLDDDGYGIDDLRLLLADLYPFDRDVSEKKLNGWLTMMTKPTAWSPIPPLCRFDIEGASYLHAVKWERHQRVNRPQPSRLPQCPVHPQRPSIGRINSMNDSLNQSVNGSRNGSLRARQVQGSGVQGSEVQGSGDSDREPSTEVVAVLHRPDVEALCEHLANRIEANGSRRPQITGKWRDAARLLIDRDRVTPDQVHRCIDWCQTDEFWRTNVLSMPTLRQKYDQLRLDAHRALAKANGNSAVWDQAMEHHRAEAPREAYP